MQSEHRVSSQGVFSFAEFWRWLKSHAGCLLAVTTARAALYDHEDLHWQFGEEDGSAVVQLLRGKALVGEIVITLRDVDYVQVDPEGEDEFVFDCIFATDGDAMSAYSFTLSHGYVPEPPVKTSPLIH